MTRRVFAFGQTVKEKCLGYTPKVLINYRLNVISTSVVFLDKKVSQWSLSRQRK